MPLNEELSVAENHEQKFVALEREVKELQAQLERSQRLATIGTMAAMIAHEFNNILTPVINYAQLAKKNPALVAKAIDKAAEGGLRATEICKAILGLTDDRKSELEQFNLRELVDKTISVMARKPKQDLIDITIDIPDDYCIVSEQVKLEQVLLNLLLNARNAILAGGGIRLIAISATRQDGTVFISVRDSGIGIKSEILPKIFQPFFTTSISKDPDSSGHGLGLTVCREIIRSLNGDISVESTHGAGSIFTIHLPDKS